MNYKCPNCGGSVMFNPETGKMRCTQCGKSEEDNLYYSSNDIDYDEDAADAYIDTDECEYMDTNIYICTSCGAKLMINEAEVSTFCSYCGQPTIVFDRVSKEQKPDYIIPFKINEEQAVTLIKQKFGTGRYVPTKVKNPQVDRIRGIYVPYWLYSTYIKEEANVTGFIGEEKQRSKIELYRKAECNYKHINIDASRKLNDNISIRLNPFDLRGLKPFESKYMSGFYADRYDVEKDEVGECAYLRTKSYIEEDILDSCFAGDVCISDSSVEEFEVKGIKYALLPVWFMTFWCDGELYTILVNGQTGKVVGDIPLDKKKARMDYILLLTLSITAFVFVSIFFGGLYNMVPDGRVIAAYALFVLPCVTKFSINLQKYKEYEANKKRLKSNDTIGYVKERQDKTWIR